MEFVYPKYKIECISNSPLKLIESAGRLCHKTEDKITEDSCIDFTKKILNLNHLSVIEHSMMSVRFICNRGVSHELVRHRLAAYSQESTRYCNYNKKGIAFIVPPRLREDIYEGQFDLLDMCKLKGEASEWVEYCLQVEKAYNRFITEYKWPLDDARGVLPNDLKTEIIVTCNFREWQHIFNMRTSNRAHFHIRELMIPLREEVKKLVPVIFD